MPRLTGALDFTEKAGGLSACKRKDMDGTFVRTKGGAKKKKSRPLKVLKGPAGTTLIGEVVAKLPAESDGQ